jgi:hypothetical protein
MSVRTTIFIIKKVNISTGHSSIVEKVDVIMENNN